MFGLTNVLVMFGGSKDGAFNQEISDLVGQVRVTRRTWQTGAMAGRTFSGENIAILRPEEIRGLAEGHALVPAENGKPIIARLTRCIDGKAGRRLLAAQRQLRAQLAKKLPRGACGRGPIRRRRSRGATSRHCGRSRVLPMTGALCAGADSMALVKPFPQPGMLVQLAYRELDLATSRQQDHLLPLRDLAELQRPWDLGTCQTPQLRKEVWSSLEAVVSWLNHEHVWDVADVIPTCWPRHPHLVHEIAVLTDQRHRAGQVLTSDPLEEWHRQSLPSFTERMRSRLRNHCQEDHQSWPAKARYTRHIGEGSRRRLIDAYAADVRALKWIHDQDESPRLGLVDLETGEIKQPRDSPVRARPTANMSTVLDQFHAGR
jgi:hypothetical protein